jgi:glycosyltransferase involved in cell wall biosynthesis
MSEPPGRPRAAPAAEPGEVTGPASADPEAALAELVERSGIRRVDVVAWRDLDDAEAGGSEIHAHEVLSRWAATGLDVHLRSSRVDGAARSVERSGYSAHRIAGRYAVFPRTALRGFSRSFGTGDAVVEIWNGMPFFSPLWARRPRIVFLHHVHGEMWQMVLPAGLARLGTWIERSLAPPIYRRESIVTLSESAKREIVQLGMAPERVTVAPPGIDARFTPGGPKDEDPLVITVGRLVPVKRFGLFVEAMAKVRAAHPNLRAMIIGEGYERPTIEARIREAGAEEWLTLGGRVSEEALIELYRRAWVVVSTSAREGWGMTLTEAGACGTPSVAVRIAGPEDAVVDGVSGLLVGSAQEVATAVEAVLSDPELRARLSDGARQVASRFSWDQTALRAFQALAAEAARVPLRS